MHSSPSATAWPALVPFGFTPFFQAQMAGGASPALDPSLEPARVLRVHRGGLELLVAGGEMPGVLSGALLAGDAFARAVCGDWVLCDAEDTGGRRVVRRILERSTLLSRKAAGRRADAQPIAANVDHVLIVTAANKDFSAPRLERYLALVRASGAEATIVIGKADLVDDVAPFLDEAKSLRYAGRVLAISNVDGRGVEEVRAMLGPTDTIALIGSSGVGKSTLINRLIGAEVQLTSASREHDDRGRHTTTTRTLVPLAEGGVLLDTPGMREVGLFASLDEALLAYEELDAIAATCRFRDCKHAGEPGCEVARALADGTLSHERLAARAKLAEELNVERQRALPEGKARRPDRNVARSSESRKKAKR